MIGYRHDASQVARDVRYYAHAQPTLLRSPRKLETATGFGSGDRCRARGRAAASSCSQAAPPGSKRWVTFRNATANAQGQFHASYRFTHTTRKITYRFRAVVPDQAGYPWVGGNSAPVRVRVTPKKRRR